MKRIYLIIIISIITLSGAIIPLACKRSFLEQTNTFGIPADGAASTKGNVIAAVNGIYDTYQNSDLLKKCIWYRANFGTHDFFNWGADVFWNNYQIPATFLGLNTLWNQFYIGIAGAHYAIPVIAKPKATYVLAAA